MQKLSGTQVDIWILETSTARVLPDALTEQEQAQLQKISSPSKRESSRRSRNHLRWLLADYLDEEPKKIQMAYGAQGKPELRPPKNKIQFNLSHSADITVYAFAQSAVGIDIEKIETRTAADRIAKRFFSSINFKIFKSLAGVERTHFFFKVWTASEAYVKGLGKGAFGIQKVREHIEFSNLTPEQIVIKEWTIMGLKLAPGYAAALAVKSVRPEVRVLKI